MYQYVMRCGGENSVTHWRITKIQEQGDRTFVL